MFFSKSSNNKGGFLHPGTINNIITKVCDDSGIVKNITPHILRHTAATYDGAYLNEDQMCLKYGWVKGSDMPHRYCHQNADHLKDFLKKNAGLTDEVIIKESICPNCQESNNINALRCSKCNYILDRELLNKTVSEKEEREKALNDRINELSKESKENKDILTELVDRIDIFSDIYTKTTSYFLKKNKMSIPDYIKMLFDNESDSKRAKIDEAIRVIEQIRLASKDKGKLA